MSDTTGDRKGEITGRRERKRRRTQRAIERAAVAIALEEGYAGTAVAAVCERADVARSTFFNYMPSLDAAIFGPALHLIPQDDAVAILDADAANLPRALNLVSLACVGDSGVDPVVMAGRRRLVQEQPDTLVKWEETFIPLRHELVALMVGWLAAHPEHRVLPTDQLVREALLLVNTSGCVAAVLMDQWADVPDGQDLAAGTSDFDRAFDDLRRVIAAQA